MDQHDILTSERLLPWEEGHLRLLVQWAIPVEHYFCTPDVVFCCQVVLLDLKASTSPGLRHIPLATVLGLAVSLSPLTGLGLTPSVA